MQKNHFLLLKKLKNTETAQLCWLANHVAHRLQMAQFKWQDDIDQRLNLCFSPELGTFGIFKLFQNNK